MITGPLGDAPIDLLSGRADASLQLTASGYSPSAILATLGGRVTLTVKDGTVSGFDLFRLKLAVDEAGSEVGGSRGERRIELWGDRVRPAGDWREHGAWRSVAATPER